MNFAFFLEIISGIQKLQKRVLEFVTVLLLIGTLSSCLGTRYLEDDEYLLNKQKIEGVKNADKSALRNLYTQSTNEKLGPLPFSYKAWLFHTGEKFFNEDKLATKRLSTEDRYDQKILAATKDKKVKKLSRKKAKKLDKIDNKLEEGNFLMRLGEHVAVYDSLNATKTVDRMSQYLHAEGYFRSQIDLAEKKIGKTVDVTYKVSKGPAYTIDSIYYTTDNEDIRTIIFQNKSRSPLKLRNRYRQSKIIDHQSFIKEILRNNGYFSFSDQYVAYEIDTGHADDKATVNVIIQNPEDGKHKLFKIDSIDFITDAQVTGIQQRQSNYYQGINYRYFEKKFSQKLLNQRVFFRPGTVYNQSDVLATQRQLSNLDMFRFININFDTTGNDFQARIAVSPLPKWQTSNELGLNVSQGLPGPFYNLSLKNRNTFGALEILDMNFRVSLDGLASATSESQVFQSVETSGSIGLTFPQFILPLTERARARLAKLNPRTQTSLGVNFSRRPEYIRTGVNASLSYSWDKKNWRNTLTLLDANFILSNIRDSEAGANFNDFLGELQAAGNNLFRSFESSYASSISINSIFSKSSESGKATFVRLFFESGGTTLNVGNDFLNDLPFAQFLKAQFDIRRYLPLTKTTILAFRLNTGYIYQYGPEDQTSFPYEKFFFAGGSNGIRAWTPRRLGPGSQIPEINSDGSFNYQFEQPGEVLLETSVELRQKLFGIVNGALFIDAGNVWRASGSPVDPGNQEVNLENLERGEFNINDFYREIAVGAGIGVRLDFSFLLVRLDVATKIHDPARRDIPNDPTWFFRPFGNQDETVFNLGIGYPF